MIIGYDAKRITHNATGLGNYSRFIIRILSEFFPENEYLLYTPSPGKDELRNRLNGISNVRYRYPQILKDELFKSYWRLKGISSQLNKEGVKLFHGLSNELPIGLNKQGICSIVTIHDLIFLRYPSFYPYIDRKIYAYKFKRACMEADHIIAVSEQTKKDIIQFFNIDKDKISVIYQGCDAVFKKRESLDMLNQVKRTYQLPERYILSVGSIEDRKNLLLVVKAMEKMEDKSISLLAVGRRTSYTEKVEKYIAEHHLEQRVRLISGLPFTYLPAVYQQASLFVYPSFFEGFGIPILESLYSGVPVIAAKGSCLEEAGGPDSIYVDPEDAEELAEQIDRVINSPALRMRMIKSGYEHASRFQEEVLANQLMSLYNKVLEDNLTKK